MYIIMVRSLEVDYKFCIENTFCQTRGLFRVLSRKLNYSLITGLVAMNYGTKHNIMVDLTACSVLPIR